MPQNARVSDRTVAVLAGGLSHEREVSLRSGRRLAGALRANGVDVREWDVDGALLERLHSDRPDVVAVALHGGEGENGAVQQILELLEIPFVGTPSGACRRAWDKPSVKAELVRAGLTTPDWVALPHSTFRELGAQGVLGAIVERLGLPLVLKPDQGGSALGVQVVRTAEDLPSAMVSCFAYADTVLAEQFVSGTEVAVSVVHDGDEPRALPPVEVEVPSGFYDYTSRYTPGAATFHCPARLPADVRQTLAETALLEMNVSPGLTDTSLLPTAVDADGSDLATVYQALVDRAAVRNG
jgi:D-alanine-D-alanine ligase